MKFVRFLDGSRIAYGVADGDLIEEISSTPFLPHETTGISHPLSGTRLLAPCLPSKVIGVGLNYRDHADEMGMPIPEEPMFFFKPSTSVVGPASKIVWPRGCERLDYEGELAVVIGAVAKGVSRDRWQEVVLGYTCAIDATARDQQEKDSQWGRAKGFDTAGPLGPWIETDIVPDDLALITKVNGEVKQEARTSSLIFNVGELIEFITTSITLLPGDVIMTGTPKGAGPLKDGDRVAVEIEGIGSLEVGVQGLAPAAPDEEGRPPAPVGIGPSPAEGAE
ncbi:MAG: fumarylacetoacetate hydrolase family protein [Actinomycetota bacterium]